MLWKFAMNLILTTLLSRRKHTLNVKFFRIITCACLLGGSPSVVAEGSDIRPTTIRETAMKTRQFVVTGNVQGVGFRAATAAKAKQLGVSGWVRNLDTGEVEVLASGEASQLDALAVWLESGPDAADVNTVQSDDASATPESGFNIRY